MKKQIRNQMKELVLQTLEEYFKQSGISEILVKLHKNALIQAKLRKQGGVKTNSAPIPQKKKVTNILQNNRKAMGKIQQMRQNENIKYVDDQDVDAPILRTTNTKQITPHLRAMMNQNMDPIQNEGSSILDVELPDFMAKGLSKVKYNGSK